MSKKVVLKLEVTGEREKHKALKAVSSLKGIVSLAMDMKEKKLTVIGDVDPVQIVCKLKKWYTQILTVGPAKETEKKDGKDDADKDKESKEMEELKRLYQKYYSRYTPSCHVYSVEENPNSCVIC